MHMAFALLTPRTRQLNALGLKYLVTPEECPYSPCAVRNNSPDAVRHAARSVAQPASGTRCTPPPRPAWSRDARYGQNARQQVQAQTQVQSQGQIQGQSRGQVQAGAGTYAAAPAGNAPVMNVSATDIAWPEDWQKLFARTKPGRICWTYTDLGYDLSGYASPERRKYLQELLAFMHLPKGSSTFWPVGLPKKSSDGSITLDIRPDLFWAGIKRLGVRCIIVLGDQAAEETGCQGNQRSHGCLMVVTEDINDFARAEVLSKAKIFIRNWLQRI